MSRNFNGTSDKGVYSGAVVTAPPFSIAGWCYVPSSFTGGRVMFELSDGTVTNGHTLQLTATRSLRATSTATSSTSASSAGTVALGAWTHVAGVWTSTSSRACFLNGTKATDATAKTPAGINKTTLGITGAGTNFFPGLLAEFAVWNVALTDAEVTKLAAGYPPLTIRQGALVAYYPLTGQSAPEIDVVAARNITMTGTRADAPPPLVKPAPLNRLWMLASNPPDTLFAQAWM